MTRTVGNLIIDILTNSGIDTIWGIPGQGIQPLSVAIEADDRIRFIHVRQEACAGFAAGAQSWLSNKITACLVPGGSGALHLINGLYDANKNGCPVLCLVIDPVGSEMGTRFIRETDPSTAFRGCSVWSAYAHSAEQVPALLQIALQEASWKKGVAVLVLDSSLTALENKEQQPNAYRLHKCNPHITPDEKEIHQLAELLNNTRNITILGGSGCRLAHAEILQLSKLLKAPVAWSSRGKQFLDYGMPYPVGMPGSWGNGVAGEVMRDSDLLLILGSRFPKKNCYPRKAKIIQIDEKAEHLGLRHWISAGYQGKIRETLQALLPLIQDKKTDNFAVKETAKYYDVRKKLLTLPTGEHISSEFLFTLLNKKIDKNACLSADTGTPFLLLNRFIDSFGTRTFYNSENLGAMGNAIPDAMGLKLAAPDRQVIALSGDGGLSMLMGELLTLIQEKIDIKIVVVNNGCLGATAMNEYQRKLPEVFTHLENPDFAEIAQKIGITGFSAKTTTELEDQMVEWLDAAGPALLNVQVTPYLAEGQDVILGGAMLHRQATVSDVLVDTLEAIGNERIYGEAAISAVFLNEAIAKSKIRFVQVRNPETAAFAAGADAMSTGKLGVCLATSGSGTIQMLNSVCDANRNGSPVLVIATEIRNKQIGLRSVQETDIRGAFSACTVFCEYLRTPEQLPHLLEYAIQSAITLHGVSMIIIPQDYLNKELPFDAIRYLPHLPTPAFYPNEKELQEIALLINQAQRPVIFGGAGCNGAHDEIMELAGQIKAPVGWSSRAKKIFDYDNPYPVGMNGILGHKGLMKALKGCDLLLILGSGFAFREYYPDHCTIIQIDREGSELARRHWISRGIVGDMQQTMIRLLPRIAEKTDEKFALECTAEYNKEIVSELRELTYQKENEYPIQPGQLAECINRYAPENASIVADMGTAWFFMSRFIETYGTRTLFQSALHGSLGSALPYSIGIQAAHPDQCVISLSGDGGFAMMMGEILTLVQEKLPVKIFLFNNGYLNFAADSCSDVFLRLENPDFAAIATASGVTGVHISRIDELEDKVRQVFETPGPVIVNVNIDLHHYNFSERC